MRHSTAHVGGSVPKSPITLALTLTRTRPGMVAPAARTRRGFRTGDGRHPRPCAALAICHSDLDGPALLLCCSA